MNCNSHGGVEVRCCIENDEIRLKYLIILKKSRTCVETTMVGKLPQDINCVSVGDILMTLRTNSRLSSGSNIKLSKISNCDSTWKHPLTTAYYVINWRQYKELCSLFQKGDNSNTPLLTLSHENKHFIPYIIKGNIIQRYPIILGYDCGSCNLDEFKNIFKSEVIFDHNFVLVSSRPVFYYEDHVLGVKYDVAIYPYYHWMNTLGYHMDIIEGYYSNPSLGDIGLYKWASEEWKVMCENRDDIYMEVKQSIINLALYDTNSQ